MTCRNGSLRFKIGQRALRAMGPPWVNVCSSCWSEGVLLPLGIVPHVELVAFVVVVEPLLVLPTEAPEQDDVFALPASVN